MSETTTMYRCRLLWSGVAKGQSGPARKATQRASVDKPFANGQSPNVSAALKAPTDSLISASATR